MSDQKPITPIYVARDLHAKLKQRAAKERTKLGKLCEQILWPAVRRNGKEAAK